MSVTASEVRKTISLTNTLMGGYTKDLFHLPFRALPGRMMEDGYVPSRNGSMNAAAMPFMWDRSVLRDIYSGSDGPAHKTAKGSKVAVRTVQAPGVGPKFLLRCILPYTIFLKPRDIGGVLPPYDEEFREAAMSVEQGEAYQKLFFLVLLEIL